jgi:hypothetical protein
MLITIQYPGDSSPLWYYNTPEGQWFVESQNEKPVQVSPGVTAGDLLDAKLRGASVDVSNTQSHRPQPNPKGPSGTAYTCS